MANNNISALPYSLEAEQSVLGSILIDQELQFEIASQLNKDDFYVESHKLVFEGISSVLALNKPVDLVTLADEMNQKPVVQKGKRKVNISTLASEMENKTILERAGGIEYITELANVTPSSANYQYYLDIVKRDSTLRKLIRSSEEIIKDAKVSDDSAKSLSLAEKLIYDISQNLETTSLTNINDNTNDVLDLYQNIQNDKNFLQGLNTGFTSFDKMTNGLHKGNLIILAARPAVGKTTFVMNIVTNIAIKTGAVCAVFELEMTKPELTERILCSVGGVNNQKAKTGQLDINDWKKLWDAQKWVNRSNIFVDDTSMTTVPEILSKCRRLKATKGRLDLVVVDHIQLMEAVKKSESRQAEITEISRGLKMIAKELNVPVIALSQLSRLVERRSDQRPVLSDLRESGAIEQDADIVMFIHRNKPSPEEKDKPVNKNETEIIIEKNRSGPTGSFKLMFKGEQNKFINYVANEPEEPGSYNRNSGLEQVNGADAIPKEVSAQFDAEEIDSNEYKDEIF